jgi:hypothetical protein
MDESKSIIGTYSLLSAEFVNSDGKVLSSPIGSSPLGRAMFNADGYMSAIITNPENIKSFPKNTSWTQASDADVAFVARNMGGYSGKYEVFIENGELTLSTIVEVSMDPGWMSTTQVRRLSWRGEDGKQILVHKPVSFIELPVSVIFGVRKCLEI